MNASLRFLATGVVVTLSKTSLRTYPRSQMDTNSPANNSSTVEIIPHQAEGSSRPAHHANDKQTAFVNPWPSYQPRPLAKWIRRLSSAAVSIPKVPADIATLIPSRIPTWGADADPASMKATWLGHAAFLIELPTPEGAARGPRILFDPALSKRCLSSNYVGPVRFRPTPCPTKDLPPIDVIILSHDHYDHTDAATISTLASLHAPHVFAGLGNAPLLASLGVQKTHIHTLDWWDAALVSVSLPSSQPNDAPTVPARFRVTCTPSQHFSGRILFQRGPTLWASWAVEELPPAPSETGRGKSVWFAGDTGYRSFEAHDAPVCPAFAEIGKRIGGFDLALLPIGAYGPHAFWCNVHASPADSVDIFRDVRARRGLGMHWGTWVLTTEPVMEPPQQLREACAAAGLAEGEFDICGLGETRLF